MVTLRAVNFLLVKLLFGHWTLPRVRNVLLYEAFFIDLPGCQYAANKETCRIFKATPRKKNDMEPENTPLEKENHFPKRHQVLWV